MSGILNKIDNVIEHLSSKNSFTNVYGLARTLMALGTIFTLIFSSPDTLFRPGGLEIVQAKVSLLAYFNFFKLLDFKYINILRFGAVALLCVVASGWRPRFTGIIQWWLAYSFVNSVIIIEGGDQVISNISFLLLPVTLMDPRKSHWGAPAPAATPLSIRNLISNFCFGLIRLQMSVIYFHAAVGKIQSDDWQNGTALYYWFVHPIFGLSGWLKPIFMPLVTNSHIVVMLTWGTIIFEIALFMGLVLQQSYRYLLLILGILFHFLIAIIHGLPAFSLAMDGGLLLYFYPVDKSIHFFDRYADPISSRVHYFFITKFKIYESKTKFAKEEGPLT